MVSKFLLIIALKFFRNYIIIYLQDTTLVIRVYFNYDLCEDHQDRHGGFNEGADGRETLWEDQRR